MRIDEIIVLIAAILFFAFVAYTVYKVKFEGKK